MGLFSGPGVTPSLKGLVSNVISLASGQTWIISPAGWYSIKAGKYTAVQQYDPITGIWRSIGGGSTSAPQEYFYSDGVNYRLANQMGCTVGAYVTTAGASYTSPPTVTASGGSPIFKAIIGGAVNTTVTVTNGGSNYTYPPAVFFSAPPPGGVQATGHCTISANAVATVVVDDQGAGYASAPTITFLNDPREGLNGVTAGSGAAAITTLTGAGTVTAVLVLDHGAPLTGQTAVPTLTFSGGGGTSAAATAVVNWAIQAYTVTASGSGYSGNILISAYGPTFSGASYTNPTIQNALMKGRNATIIAALSGANITATGQTVLDGGSYPGVPSFIVYANGAGATLPSLGFTMGSVTNDVSYVTPV
jgi:hypothetical protein